MEELQNTLQKFLFLLKDKIKILINQYIFIIKI